LGYRFESFDPFFERPGGCDVDQRPFIPISATANKGCSRLRPCKPLALPGSLSFVWFPAGEPKLTKSQLLKSLCF
jgi:hypothetical protein